MAITDTWLKANNNKERDVQEEKTDGNGMSARVSPKGKITFQLRFRHDGKQARIDIGTYPLISLKDARAKCLEYRAMIENGVDPRVEKKLAIKKNTASGVLTLQALFDQWNEKYLARAKKSATSIARSFEIHIMPELGPLPANRINIDLWLSILEPLAAERPAIAYRILSNAKQMMNWAIRRGLCDTNPLQAIDSKDDLHIEYVPTDRVLIDEEIHNIFKALTRGQINPRNRVFIQLLFIYGARCGELRLAKKAHIDREKMIWTVPPENHKTGQKTGKPLIRPITKETLYLFDYAVALNDSEYLFVSNWNKAEPMAQGTLLSIPYQLMNIVDREAGKKMDHWSLHDIRRTMRTNMSSITEPHIAEIMIGHVMPLVWRTYDQHDYINEQRAALEKWTERLRGIISPLPLV